MERLSFHDKRLYAYTSTVLKHVYVDENIWFKKNLL